MIIVSICKRNIISKIISNKKAFIISNGNEKNLIKKLKIKEVNYNSSKFILSLSLKPNENTVKIMKNLKILAKRNIPMICTNPDIYTFFKGNYVAFCFDNFWHLYPFLNFLFKSFCFSKSFGKSLKNIVTSKDYSIK